jgi:hypothetical protein
MKRARRRVITLAGVVAVLAAIGGLPSAAYAHGPVDPIASSYLARVASVPPGLEAKVVDGDQRLWLRAVPSETVVVLDYRGAPYLRLSRSGVDVNQNSAMYYLNQSPAEVAPSGLGPSTPPRWSRISGDHATTWHDGRLHALASVAITPATAYVGRWSIPVRVDGRIDSISGGLWHHGRPSIVWFWPIVVLIMCTLAARRVRRPELDARIARVLAVPALLAIATAGVARELHGRPAVSVGQLVTFAILVAFVAWGLRQVLRRDPTYFTYFAIAFVALWEGAQLIPTLVNGFVLAAGPAFAARAASVVCIGCGVGLLIIPSRLADDSEPDPSSDDCDAGDGIARESYA